MLLPFGVVDSLDVCSLQSFISGIGNWMADEVLYQVSLLYKSLAVEFACFYQIN